MSESVPSIILRGAFRWLTHFHRLPLLVGEQTRFGESAGETQCECERARPRNWKGHRLERAVRRDQEEKEEEDFLNVSLVGPRVLCCWGRDREREREKAWKKERGRGSSQEGSTRSDQGGVMEFLCKYFSSYIRLIFIHRSATCRPLLSILAPSLRGQRTRAAL